MGRGLQVPDDIPIMLDSDDAQIKPPSFWELEQGVIIQTQILHMIQALVVALHEDPEIVDAACSVLKTGFTEATPGAFVFPPHVITNFLIERASTGTRIETIVGTAAIMMSSHSAEGAASIAHHAQVLLGMVVALIEKYQGRSSDPSVFGQSHQNPDIQIHKQTQMLRRALSSS